MRGGVGVSCFVLFGSDGVGFLKKPFIAKGFVVSVEFSVKGLFDSGVLAVRAVFELIVLCRVGFATTEADFEAERVFAGVAIVGIGRVYLAIRGSCRFLVGTDRVFGWRLEAETLKSR